MFVTAIIQARMNSTRFPGKVLAELDGKPVLQHVIEAVRACKLVNAAVVATGPSKDNALIAVACERWDIPCIRDEDSLEEDVLGRFVLAASRVVGTELVVRVCGDSPRLDAPSTDNLIEAAIAEPAAYWGYRLDGKPAVTVANGYFAEVVTPWALRCGDGYLDAYDKRREDVTSVLYGEPEVYSCRWLPVPKWYKKSAIKLAAVDTPEDLERLRRFVV